MDLPTKGSRLDYTEEDLDRIMDTVSTQRKLKRGVREQKTTRRLSRKQREDMESQRIKREIQKQKEKLLSQKEKEAIAAKSYLESEKTEFERQLQAFEKDFQARKGSSATNCDELMGDSHACIWRKNDRVLKRDLAIANHEYNFVRMYGESDEEVEERVKAEHYNIDLELNMINEDYQPQVVDPAILSRIRALNRQVPRWLYRVSSWQGTKSTNGHDQIHFHLPAAFKNFQGLKHDPQGWNYVLARTIDDEYNDLGQLVEKLGRRLLWLDRKNDPTLSWTSSLLFALVLATARLAKEQQYVVIHVIDTTEVRRVDDPDAPVEFFLAQDLLREFDIQGWNWKEFVERPKLRKPYYTHEWITHHAVLVPKGSEQFAYEARLEDLIDGGLYELVEKFKTDEEDDMKGLYHRCVYTRSYTHRQNSPYQKPITDDDLDLAVKLTKCFKWKHRVDKTTRVPRPGSGSKQAPATPHVNIVLDLLGMHERPSQNPVLQNWATSGFGGFNFSPSSFDGLTRIPNNIPEQIQSVELARDVCQAVQAPDLPPTQVWLADSRFNWHGKWLPLWSFSIKIRQKDPKKRKRSNKGGKQGDQGSDDPPDAPGAGGTNGSDESPDQDHDSDKSLSQKRQKTHSADESPDSAVDSATGSQVATTMSDAQASCEEPSDKIEAGEEVAEATA